MGDLLTWGSFHHGWMWTVYLLLSQFVIWAYPFPRVEKGMRMVLKLGLSGLSLIMFDYANHLHTHGMIRGCITLLVMHLLLILQIWDDYKASQLSLLGVVVGSNSGAGSTAISISQPIDAELLPPKRQLSARRQARQLTN